MSEGSTPSRPSIRDRLRRLPAAAIEWLRHAPENLRGLLRAADLDTRLLGLVVVLALMWIAFNIASDGTFLSPRNLWNLSVQSASIAIMATGMVLVIVSRNIDLSVGAMLGFIGYTMAMAQTVWLPETLGLGLGHPAIPILAVVLGLVLGLIIGGIQGFVIAYGVIPSFIVTLGGLLAWRGLIFQYAQGQTIAPMDPTFRLLGGGPQGSLGEWGSWALGIIAVVVVLVGLALSRRRQGKYGFQVRPVWATAAIAIVLTAGILGAVAVVNAYPWPEALAAQYAEANGIEIPPGGLIIPTGIAYPVLIMIAVGIVMTHIAERRRFGRNVYAIGGNPQAAELSGINTKRTVMFVFALMGAAGGRQRGRPDGSPQRRGHRPRRHERAGCHQRGRHRRDVVRRRHRHHPGRHPRRRGDAVPPLRNGPARRRLADAGHRRRRRARRRGRARLVSAEEELMTVQEQASVSSGANAAGYLVEMEDIRVSFGGVHAVDGVSINLRAGEVVGLVGGNGAGKSTLMKVLSGAQVADSGEIRIGGEVASISNPRDARSFGIECIYQTLALADNLHAPANVFLGRELVEPGRRPR